MAKLLVIDDDAALRETVVRTLRFAGHDVLEAKDGREGLDVLGRMTADAVITDVLMPGIDGIELARKIKSAFPLMPVVAISAADGAWAAAQTFGWTGADKVSPLTRARSAGVDATVGKPFEPQELMEAVERVLAAAQRPSGRRSPTSFHVKPEARGGWRIHRDGSQTPSARIGDRDGAVFLAKRLAGAHPYARVIVYRPDDTVDAVFNYGSDGSE